MSNYVYYPDLDNVDFYKKIFLKKEFRKNDFKKINSNNFSLLPQQLFLKNYININTPYNSILVYHGTGVGKTCSAITIAEGFKKYLKNKKIIVLLQRNIKENFIKELYNLDKTDNKQCTGTTYKYKDEFKYDKKEKKLLQIKKNIRKYYKFYGYTQFANKVIKLTGWDGNPKNLNDNIKSIIKKIYSDNLFIIDEVHHIKSFTDNLLKKIPIILETIFKYTENIKLVMMSATPMYDTPREIVFLLNLMLVNDNRKKIEEKDIFNKNDELIKDGEKKLKKNLVGYISYFRGENPETFPLRFYPEDAIIPTFKYDFYGKVNNNNIKYIKIFPSYLSNEHYKYYSQIESKEINSNIKFVINKLQQISNIIYKNSKGEYTYGKNGFRKTDDGLGSFYTVTKKINKKLYKYYKYQKNSIINYNKSNEKSILDISNISSISSKMYNIINNIINSYGLVFIYSEYIDSGTLPVALALEQAGYERYVLGNENQLLDYSKNSNGGGGKNFPRCYKCGQSINHPNHNESNKNYHKFKVGKYALLSGDNIDLKDINRHIQIFNSKNNLYGEELRIIIGTRRLSEGIDLHNIRHVHIMEPWWNLSRLEQIIGRAIRHKSHINLPEDERNVEIYNYASLPPKDSNNKETIDIYKYKESEKKDINIKNIEYILKQSAIDCNIFKDNNVRISNNIITQKTSRGKIIKINKGDKPYSRECNYKKDCNYSCVWEKKNNKNKINRSTYTFNMTNSLSIKIKKYIQDMYYKSYIYTLNDISKYIKSIDNISDIHIYNVLNKFIVDKLILNDKFRRKGYLIYKGDYYIYQPLGIENERLPMYYRNLITTRKNKFIKIDNNNGNKLKSKNIDLKKILHDIENTYKKYNQYIINNLTDNKDFANNIIIDMIIDNYSLSVINNLRKIKKNKLLNIYFKNIKEKGLQIKNTKIEIDINNSNKINSNLYGIFVRDNEKRGLFKIINKTKKDDLTINKKLSKRSKLTGRVCNTYDMYYLKQFYDKMNKNILNINSKIKKNLYCIYIEFLMRYNQKKDKKNTYFIYNN